MRAMCEYVVKIEWHMHILSPVIKFNNADKFSKNTLDHWHKAVIKFAGEMHKPTPDTVEMGLNLVKGYKSTMNKWIKI